MDVAERRHSGLQLSWVAFGWFVAAAITAAVVFVLIQLGLVTREAPGAASWTLVAIIAGFGTGGFFTARRASDAPVAHGLAIGGFSVVVWLVANLLAQLVDAGTRGWAGLPLGEALTVLLVQAIAATGGAWLGRRWTHSG